MNTVYQGLYEKACEILDERERYNYYVNHSIDYLSERIEVMIINAGDLEKTKLMVRKLEDALDRVAGVH